MCSFCYGFKCFLDYQITDMPKLLIRIITDLLIYKFVAELFNNLIINHIAFLRFEYHNYIIALRLLMNEETVCKFIASSDNDFFCIQCYINNDLKPFVLKFCNRKFKFSHSHFQYQRPVSTYQGQLIIRRSVALICHFF